MTDVIRFFIFIKNLIIGIQKNFKILFMISIGTINRGRKEASQEAGKRTQASRGS